MRSAKQQAPQRKRKHKDASNCDSDDEVADTNSSPKNTFHHNFNASDSRDLISSCGWPWFRSFASRNKLVLILLHSLINEQNLVRHSNRSKSEKERKKE